LCTNHALRADENSQVLGVVYHSRFQTEEALQSALAQMHSHFPHAVTLEGSMRGHHFCEDLSDTGWPQAWETDRAPEWPQAREEEPASGEHDPQPDIDIDR